MFGAKVDDPKGKITWQLIMGAVLFGFGWGLGGLCPGPYVLASVHSLRLAVFWGIPFLLFMKLSSVLFGPKAITETGPADKAE